MKSNCSQLSLRQRDIRDREVKRMLELAVIKHCESEHTSPMILAEAPGKGSRLVVDCRKLNALTKDQVYPIPKTEEIVEQVIRAAYVTTLDLTRGYWQVPLTNITGRYAAFVTPTGSCQPTMTSFGLKNAPFCFSCLMDRFLKACETFARNTIHVPEYYSEVFRYIRYTLVIEEERTSQGKRLISNIIVNAEDCTTAAIRLLAW